MDVELGDAVWFAGAGAGAVGEDDGDRDVIDVVECAGDVGRPWSISDDILLRKRIDRGGLSCWIWEVSISASDC